MRFKEALQASTVDETIRLLLKGGRTGLVLELYGNGMERLRPSGHPEGLGSDR
ncbi:MAG: hypothetical protein WAN40_06045 [Thermoplasmata archaeon]